MARLAFFLFSSLFSVIALNGHEDSALVIIPDDSVLMHVDSVWASNYIHSLYVEEALFDSSSLSHNKNRPHVDEAVYADRLHQLNLTSPINLTYNRHVKNYINTYANTKNTIIEKMLGLAPFYFPIFEELLDQYNLPLELKYLPIIESALNPKARSRTGATGLWQFMYRTGRMYGLEVTSYYDERKDVYKSTDAACRYLKRLHEIYKDWTLALAAYNCGPGNVNKAIRRSGGKRNYWEIRSFLPAETRGYIPAFIAATYIMQHANDHNIYPKKPKVDLCATDTVTVKNYVSLQQVSEVLKLPLELVTFLNPTYSKDFIPNLGNAKTLCLPAEKIGLFLANEKTIYQRKSKQDVQRITQINKNGSFASPHKGEPIVYRVKNGDVLGTIAERYRCRVSQIKQWNNLRSDRLRIGQKLYIYAKPSYAAQNNTKAIKDAKKAGNDSKYLYHTIKPGDNLWDIAKKYNGVSVYQLQRLNPHLNSKRLKLGSKLKIKPIG